MSVLEIQPPYPAESRVECAEPEGPVSGGRRLFSPELREPVLFLDGVYVTPVALGGSHKIYFF